MSWFANLFSGQAIPDQRLPIEQQQRLRDWRQSSGPDLTLPHHQSRYVVVDVEGGNPESRADRPLVIGALAVDHGVIDFQDAFHLSLNQGIEPTDASPQAFDLRAAEGLIDFLHFVGKAPLVVYHSMFAAKTIARTLAHQLRVEMMQPWLDLALVMSDLFRDVGENNWHLDSWLNHFGIESIDRHRAVSDALATAQLLQIAMARAARNGIPSPQNLLELEKARRHMYSDG
ncbi:MAG TPA: 3'-5' exonuclease [Accumulibacter sp.]|nr:3'-5' exonuclease [Accumulibacter sp.]HNC19033.1 3'-5' exonuclease [Accumulibacter sp.]HND81511.1 3'-5' exonuclease [Accumulibacter sp.]HNE14145.1 3'-5' exonuclease [Accumulibacter sp.]HNG39865.1 3'-5' exonuclease [Accumulibacter sp.]